MEVEEPSAHRLIATYMSSTTALQTYLHRDGPLTPLQLDLITQTIRGLQVFLDDWQDRNCADAEALPTGE